MQNRVDSTRTRWALGAGGPQFESVRPDHDFRHLAVVRAKSFATPGPAVETLISGTFGSACLRNCRIYTSADFSAMPPHNKNPIKNITEERRASYGIAPYLCLAIK